MKGHINLIYLAYLKYNNIRTDIELQNTIRKYFIFYNNQKVIPLSGRDLNVYMKYNGIKIICLRNSSG